MRRLGSASSILLVLSLAPSCHRTQAAPLPSPDATDGGSALGALVEPSALSQSPETQAQIEPALAVTAAGGVAIAWMGVRAGRASAIGARFSRDGGSTWGEVQTLTSPDDRTASEPVLAADAAGTLYLGWLGTGPDDPPGTADSHVYVARADAATGRFGAPVDVTDGIRRGSRLTKPGIAVSSSGAVLVTWAYTSPGGDGIGVARAVDGLTWTKGVVIERISLHASLPYVCASAHGDRVWIAYLDTEAGVRIRASDDGGAMWSPARVSTVSTGDERALIAADTPVCTGDADNVTVAYGRVRSASAAAKPPVLDTIVVAKSFDGGRTFDVRRTLDAGPSVMMHPQLAREVDGALDLAFYASPTAPDGPPDAARLVPDTGSLRWVRAADDRAPLTAIRVARDHFRFEPSPSEKTWPGSYFGWAWREGTLYAASIDNVGEMAHVALTRLPAR